MENEEKVISKKERESYKLAKAIQDATRAGRAGEFIEFNDLSTQQLELILNEVQEIVDWRALPGGNPGGH